MDEDLAEEACILRRLWPGSIEKEKQRMNAVSLRKKKERSWKLETLRRLSSRTFLRSISSRRKDLRNRQGSSDDFKLMHPKTSGVSIEICFVGYLRDHLIGTVRFLPSNFLPTATVKVPSLVVLRSVVLLEISKSVQEKGVESHREQKMIKSRSVVSFDDQGGSSKDNSLSGSVNFSYVGTDLMWSSPLPSPLRDWNAIRNQAGKNQVRSSSDGGGLMCCCLMKSSGMIPGS
ncbi:hypothetical protein IGI04_006845 [Brassica rapa subsp. trilocularis]|uniref:Uncharacterized protein n=1 Tax=Brassica rapa subsp. trilocularis TaxID=1813537 RepID=A0ABQ7NK63_BRACM|nr:hypothetical protein IGI04_006845 [Brassica rapa subsp. trilocularis]